MFLLHILQSEGCQHGFIRQKEMIDFINEAIYTSATKLHLMRCLSPPFVSLQLSSSLFGQHLIASIHLEPSTNHGITYGEAVGKERCLHIFVNHIEPKRQFTQLDGRRIQVHTIHIMCGDIGLHLLQLIPITVGSWLLFYISHVGFR